MHVNMYTTLLSNTRNKPYKPGILRHILQIRKQRHTMLYNLPKATDDLVRLEHKQ